MKHLEALISRLGELREYKEQIRTVQNKAFDLRLHDELICIQKVYSDLDTRIEQIEAILERSSKSAADRRDLK